MTIWNLGSINADMVYAVPHLPQAGETLAASTLRQFLGGKGANMSVAAARGGAHAAHVGAVGTDGGWAVERLTEYGVDTRFIDRQGGATGHAIIAVDPTGENQILIWPGTNRTIPEDLIGKALTEAAAGDILLIQNETNAQDHAARMGRDLGLKVAYAAAPFEAAAVRAVLPFIDILILNAVEAEQLAAATGILPADLPVAHVVITLGADGARHIDTVRAQETHYPAVPVTPVDTTGAGDTVTGFLLAGLDRGLDMAQAMELAMQAGALMVTRHGTADVIPDLKEVQAALGR
ncbi:ribokinase [Chachezhania sediminis]|uniref:ribokinase n=1 Tax=Chachezhania sediminis TaxID=2599291 RepID=UPI00131C13A9|nr:ribokinase [Chachezhania sediminis]